MPGYDNIIIDKICIMRENKGKLKNLKGKGKKMKIDISGSGINIEDEKNLLEASAASYDELNSGAYDYTGWVSLPHSFDKALLEDIKSTADEISEKCTLCVVIGIGGSYLGAKAVIDALGGCRNGRPELVFAGYNMSASTLKNVTDRMDNEDVCLIVISKSGKTVEPLLSYSILKEKMLDKYSTAEAGRRIYVLTDEEKGELRAEAAENQYKSFVVPSDIGGRYSVLSVVGLLPVAVAGHNIDRLLDGAADTALDKEWKGTLLHYAVSRVALQRDGKCVEVFEYFEDKLRYFGEWLKQLFGESEGKDGKGAYPACLCFSRDLHSIGQFLQQGSQIFHETMLSIGKSEYDFEIPENAGYPYAGKSLEQINDCAEKGVILAHRKNGIPVITIEIPELNEYYLGKLIYFFEMSCAISALQLGVNPFNQPGVEMYKQEMQKLIREL